MGLEIVWFWLIAVLWSGYFLLEGFDFGVGILLPFLGRNEADRRTMLKTIGPVWDGNEVWLVVAAGATFAAFPAWYATMFSGFYLALLAILVLLIVRVVSFEWLEKSEDKRWRTTWRWANTAGSVGVPFLWGVALFSLLHGVPLSSSGGYSGDILDLFTAYTVFAGIVLVLVCALHGATFLSLRTGGGLGERADLAATRLAPPVAVLGAGLLVWTVVVAHNRNARGVLAPAIPAAVAAGALVLAVVFLMRRRAGPAFAMTAVGVIGVVATLFTALYPRLMVSHPTFANSLTISNASSSHYALTVITVVAAIFTPIVLLYQAWTYHVFRGRLCGEPAG
ncbi:MAG: cytochrome d ubiquinol oxidase subunit II [Thermoleophilaceae bacterium]